MAISKNSIIKSAAERLKLMDHFTTEILIEKRDFVEKLKMNVDPGNVELIRSPFEMFSSSKNEYKGLVTLDSFKIRRRRKMFDMNISFAVAEGSFVQRESLLIIESTITGFKGIFVVFVIFMLIFYIGFIISLFLSDGFGNMGWFVIPFIFIHASMMLGIPYLIIRRGVSRMKYELERDFYYMTRETTVNQKR